MRLLVKLIDNFLLLTFLVFVVSFALADAPTHAPVSDTASVFLGHLVELIELTIQPGKCPLRRLAFVEHRFELKC